MIYTKQTEPSVQTGGIEDRHFFVGLKLNPVSELACQFLPRYSEVAFFFSSLLYLIEFNSDTM
jgi:hypothetical protein